MIVDPDFLDHWRTRMLVDSLQDEMAPLYVIRVWSHCQQRRGDTFEMPAAGLKALCKAPHAAEVVEAAMVEAGFVCREGASIRVPKWAEKNAALFAAWENGAMGGRPRKEPRQNPRVTETEPMANPSETQTKPIREEKRRIPSSLRSEGKRASAPLAPDGVDQQVWSDWLTLRKAKKAPVTETVVLNARAEAGKAGMTLEAFLRIWCARGSQGLLAEWIKPQERVQKAAGGDFEPEWRRQQRERNEAFLGPASASAAAARKAAQQTAEVTNVVPIALG